jgi:hypothetical protein
MDRPDAVGHVRRQCGVSSSAQGRRSGSIPFCITEIDKQKQDVMLMVFLGKLANLKMA